MSRHYSQEETEEILRRAAQSSAEGLAHEDLVAAAAEVGIDRAAVEAAAMELFERGGALALEKRARGRRRSRLLRSGATYVIVNGFLATVDLWMGGGMWFHWVALGWGVALLLQARRTFLPSEEEVERDVAREERRVRREMERQQRTARREKRRAHELQFEQAVEAGVSALLKAIHKHVGPGSAEASAGERRGPRARVATPDDAYGEPVRDENAAAGRHSK